MVLGAVESRLDLTNVQLQSMDASLRMLSVLCGTLNQEVVQRQLDGAYDNTLLTVMKRPPTCSNSQKSSTTPPSPHHSLDSIEVSKNCTCLQTNRWKSMMHDASKEAAIANKKDMFKRYPNTYDPIYSNCIL